MPRSKDRKTRGEILGMLLRKKLTKALAAAYVEAKPHWKYDENDWGSQTRMSETLDISRQRVHQMLELDSLTAILRLIHAQGLVLQIRCFPRPVGFQQERVTSAQTQEIPDA